MYSLLSKLDESICNIIIIIHQKNVVLRSESKIKYTQKVALGSYNHIFTHKCKKAKSKPFQSLLNHHVISIEFIICCIQSLKFFNVLKVGQKYF